jgi:hypothetical protein
MTSDGAVAAKESVQHAAGVSVKQAVSGNQLVPNILPRMAIIGTGGTISSIGISSLDVLD